MCSSDLVTAQDLAEEPFVLFEPGSATRHVINRFFASQNIEPIVVMDTENVEIIKAMVASGLGIALIPYSAVAKDVRAGRFAFTRVRGRRLYRETGWVYLKSDYVPRTITEVLRIFDLMKAHFGIRPPGA